MRISTQPATFYSIFLDQVFPVTPPSSCFEIPIYQRPYSWKKEQCDETFDDCINWLKTQSRLQDLLNPAETYSFGFYMGMVIIARPDNNQDAVEIVDGQQRLTTVSLALLAAYELMRELTLAMNPENRFISNYLKSTIVNVLTRQITGDDSRLQHIFDKDRVFKKITCSICLNNALNLNDDESKSKIYKNFEYFKQLLTHYLANFHDDDIKHQQLMLITKTFLYTKFIVLETEGSDERLRLFSTLNSRGVSLSAGDLIKNDLYSKFTNMDERDTIMQNWIECRSRFDNSNEFDNLIYYYINACPELKTHMAQFNAPDQVLRKNSLFQGINFYLNQLNTDPDELLDFSENLIKGIQLTNNIISADVDNDCDASFKTVKEFSVLKAYPLIVYIYKSFYAIDPKGTNQILRDIESMLVRFLILKEEPRPLSLFLHKLMNEIHELVENDADFHSIISFIKTYLLTHHVFNELNRQKFIEILNTESISTKRIKAIYMRLFFPQLENIVVKPKDNEDKRLGSCTVRLPRQRMLLPDQTDEYDLLNVTEETDIQSRVEQITQRVSTFFDIT